MTDSNLNNKSSNLETNISELKDKNNLIQEREEIEDFTRYLEKEEMIKTLWEKCRIWFREEGSSDNRELKRCKEKIQELEEEKRTLKVENQELEEDKRILKVENQKLEEEKRTLKVENQKLEEEKRTLKVENQMISVLEKQCENLKSEIQNLEKLKSDNQTEIQNLNKKLKQNTLELDKQTKINKALNEDNDLLLGNLEELKDKNNYLENLFKEPKKLFESYLKQPDEIKVSIKNILNQESVEKFIFTGVQKDNIFSLWDYMKNQVINGKSVKELFPIFSYFLDAYNTNYESPIYALNKTNTKEEFDNDYHITGFESSVAGDITQIDLLGFYNVRTGKIVKKSVVRV